MSVMSSAGESTKQAELLELVARVHQRRRVRHEGERLHPVAEPVRGRFDVLAHALGQLGDDGGVRELIIDVVCGERRLHVVGRGGPGPEHVGGELVATRVVGGFSWSGVTVTSTPCFSASKTASASATTLRATRSNSPSGFSIGSPSAFFRR